MKIDINNLNPGTWFDFPDGDGRIKLRLANRKILDEIRTKTVKTEYEYKSGKRFEIEKVNHELSNQLLWDYIIVDWENLADVGNNIIPCNAETKYILISGDPWFTGFVNDCLEKLNDELLKRAEDSEKN